MGPHSRMVSDGEDPFRSTQNTMMNKMSTPDLRMKQSINDAQSNMFSFNGFGTRQNWNDAGLKKGPIDSRNFQGSQMDTRSLNKPKFGEGKKLTSTQQNFSKNQGSKIGKVYPSEFEETKSLNSGNSFNKFKSSGKKQSTGKKNATKANRKGRGSGDEFIDSHSESDEAVDDKGALFQKRGGPIDFTGRGFGGMNDDMDHSESEEGNN